jgi:hypothetical protein
LASSKNSFSLVHNKFRSIRQPIRYYENMMDSIHGSRLVRMLVYVHKKPRRTDRG